MATLESKNTFISTIRINNVSRMITPGTNVIPSSELEDLKKNGFFKNMVKRNKYILGETSVDLDTSEEPTMSEEEKAVIEIQELSVKEAVKVIKGNPDEEESLGILNIKVLEAIRDADKRKGVQDAVEHQIEILYEREGDEDED